MSIQDHIRATLEKRIANVTFLEVINESDQHNVPPGSESHFKVVIVSDAFDALTRIKRHRLIHEILHNELDVIHALAIHAYSPSEWAQKASAPKSPQCRGGMKGA